MDHILEPIEGKVHLRSTSTDGEEATLLSELTARAGAGRVLLLLDGLDEVHDVGNLATIRPPAGECQSGQS